MQTDLFPTVTLSFSDFWSIWPRKTAKKISEAAWYKLSITDQKKAFHDCVSRYRNTPKQFIPHASTYLNQERWEDEIIETPLTGAQILTQSIDNGREISTTDNRRTVAGNECNLGQQVLPTPTRQITHHSQTLDENPNPFHTRNHRGGI